MSLAKVLMVQGSSSSVGKSLMTAGLCRIFARTGLRVAPFKAQNMSNNAAVCSDRGEIGRAQALQALAAGVDPTIDMNPILLKPEADARSQVVVLGKVFDTLPARSYYDRRAFLWSQVTPALDRLRAEYDLVVIEGAGSPAELNLKANDIVNMAIAQYAAAPVLLVGDIDRGGVFAQLLGTLSLLPDQERALVRGLIVNKFRGDLSLFDDGIQILEERSGKPVLGVVPFLPYLGLPEEDEVPLASEGRSPVIDIVVLRLPRIANSDDFDALRQEPGVRVRFIDSPSQFGTPDAVIIPGTKSTISDLKWLRERGLQGTILAHAKSGGAVVGICGGYQMLGTRIIDSDRVESDAPHADGLGLLPVTTTFAAQKATHQVKAKIIGRSGWLGLKNGLEVEAYEIHMGQTFSEFPWLLLQQRGLDVQPLKDGAVSPDGKIWGCYLHGLFANDEFRRAWLTSLKANFQPRPMSDADRIQAGLDRLADAMSAALSISRLQQIVEEGIRR